MAKPRAPTNQLLTAGLSERIIPLEVRPVFDLCTSARVCGIARLGKLAGCPGEELTRFADRQGRTRELLIYLLERAARHMKAWRDLGFTGALYISLPTQLIEDRTLATSLDVVVASQSIEQSAFTLLVPQADYLKRGAEAANAVWRLRRAGCGIAMLMDARSPAKFAAPGAHPFTALACGGKNVWQRLKTIGPGKLGALGSWIGWAEAAGLHRIAAGIDTEDHHATARLYGFGLGEGSHFADYMPARDFVREAEAPAEASGLPPPPAIGALKRA